jgi:hypothetical protein
MIARRVADAAVLGVAADFFFCELSTGVRTAMWEGVSAADRDAARGVAMRMAGRGVAIEDPLRRADDNRPERDDVGIALGVASRDGIGLNAEGVAEMAGAGVATATGAGAGVGAIWACAGDCWAPLMSMGVAGSAIGAGVWAGVWAGVTADGVAADFLDLGVLTAVPDEALLGVAFTALLAITGISVRAGESSIKEMLVSAILSALGTLEEAAGVTGAWAEAACGVAGAAREVFFFRFEEPFSLGDLPVGVVVLNIEEVCGVVGTCGGARVTAGAATAA